jgi:hypothetical protein
MTKKRSRKDDEDTRKIKRGELVPFVTEEDYPRVHARIVHLWHEGSFTVTTHAEDEANEDGFDYLDIENCIVRGAVVAHQPERSMYRFLVDGDSADGEPMRCAVEINGTVIVVTVIGLWRGL